MRWVRKRLDDIADFHLGKMLDEQKNRGEPVPYLANVNVRWGSFDLADLRQMRFEHDEMERYGLKYGDIVMCEGGEPGRCAIWKEVVPGMVIQKALHRIRAQEGVDHRFLFYSFLHLGSTGGFAPFFTGATIKHMPRQQLAKLEVAMPPLSVQDRIASILSSYDDLIENNRRRMTLLEESARLLYQEWFVRLRFPGHEHTRVIDGVPEGWEKRRLRALLAKIENKKKIHKEAYLPEGSIPCVDQSADFIGGFTEDEEAVHSSPLPVIVFGDHTRVLKFVNFTFARGADGTQVIYPNTDEVSSEYLYLALKEIDLSNYFYARHFKFLKEKDVLLPDESIVREFTVIVKPCFEQIHNLRVQNQKLRTARDLLLPKLMSGEIAV